MEMVPLLIDSSSDLSLSRSEVNTGEMYISYVSCTHFLALITCLHVSPR